MSAFTDEQINEIIGIFTQHMGTRQYIGARYVPIFGRKDETNIEWDNTKPYEPLTIVLYQGNSYTSRQYVPSGVDILNTEFWANTGNYNAQVEQYRTEVLTFDDRITENAGDIEAISDSLGTGFSAQNTVKNYIDTKTDDINNIIPANEFNTTNTVKNYIDSEIDSINNIIPANEFSSTNTIKNYIDTEIANISLESTDTHNPIYYGADPLGVNDSTNAIQQCINANEGSSVNFSTGVYKVTNTLSTPSPIEKRVTFELNNAHLVFEPLTPRTMFDIGATEIPGFGPAGDWKTFVRNGYIESLVDGCVCFNIRPEYKDFTLVNLDIIGFQFGVIGSENGNALDLSVNECLFLYNYNTGANNGSIGIDLKGSDSAINNTRIYGYQYSIVAESGSNIIRNIHNLPRNVTPEDVAHIAFIKITTSATQFLSNCYCDTYGKFIETGDNALNVIMESCMYYSFLNTVQVTLIDMSAQTTNIRSRIKCVGCEFNFTNNSNNVGIKFNTTTNSYTLHKDNIKIESCIINGTCHAGDMIFSGYSNNYWWFNAQSGSNWNAVGCTAIPKENGIHVAFEGTVAYGSGVVTDRFVLGINGSTGVITEARGNISSNVNYAADVINDTANNTLVIMVYAKVSNLNFGVFDIKQTAGYGIFYTPVAQAGPAGLATKTADPAYLVTRN